MYTATIESQEYRNLPLSMLDESGTNPRRTFEPSKLAELAELADVPTRILHLSDAETLEVQILSRSMGFAQVRAASRLGPVVREPCDPLNPEGNQHAKVIAGRLGFKVERKAQRVSLTCRS